MSCVPTLVYAVLLALQCDGLPCEEGITQSANDETVVSLIDHGIELRMRDNEVNEQSIPRCVVVQI